MTSLKYKILLVEDLEVAQKVGSSVLTNMGCEVQIAETGKQAAEKASLEDFDMIFMDLGLPDIDGFSTTEEIRKHETRSRKNHVPIIALTAHEGEHVEITCFDANMDDFLTKPLTEEKVIEMFHRHLR